MQKKLFRKINCREASNIFSHLLLLGVEPLTFWQPSYNSDISARGLKLAIKLEFFSALLQFCFEQKFLIAWTFLSRPPWKSVWPSGWSPYSLHILVWTSFAILCHVTERCNSWQHYLQRKQQLLLVSDCKRALNCEPSLNRNSFCNKLVGPFM